MISSDLSRRLAAAVQTVPFEVRARVQELVSSADTDAEAISQLENDHVTATIFQTGR